MDFPGRSERASGTLRVALLGLPGAPDVLGRGALPAPRNAPGPSRRERIARAIAAAGAAGAQVVLTPECAWPGYAPGATGDGGLDTLGWAAEAAAAAGVHLALGVDAGRWAGLAWFAPDGAMSVHPKRFPTPAESRAWDAGPGAQVRATPFGAVGLLVCADVLHRRAWEDLAGRVDLVCVAAAWPDYDGRLARLPAPVRPLARPVVEGSAGWRAAWLPRAARAVGAPVVLCDARGPRTDVPGEGFLDAPGAWDAGGAPLPLRVVPQDDADTVLRLVDVPVGRVAPRGAAASDAGWRAFAAGYRAAAGLVRLSRPRRG